MSAIFGKYLIKHITILNVFILSIIIFTFIYIFLPLLTVTTKITLPPVGKIPESGMGKKGEPVFPSPSDYMLVADENIFHPERKIPPDKKEEKPLPKPEFVLYGTMITDDFSIAYLEDLKEPRSTKGRGKRQIPLNKGDSLSGFTLQEIAPDKITMTRGEEKVIVRIHDQNYKKAVSSPSKSITKPVLPPPKPVTLPPPRSEFDSVIREFFDKQDSKKNN
ncbi:MAG: hypothetical protein RDU01_08200 [Thermodesulfovibrionales bacterium]|nr:hypothetical protein [Thermodesulfovibrionales bacterium]